MHAGVWVNTKVMLSIMSQSSKNKEASILEHILGDFYTTSEYPFEAFGMTDINVDIMFNKVYGVAGYSVGHGRN